MIAVKILLVGLMIIGFGLMFWLIRLSRGLPAEFRPPFGLAGPFEFLRLDYYSDRGRTSIAKAACAMALLSFFFVAVSLLVGLLPPPEQVRPGTPKFPPDFFFVLASSMFFITALLAGLVLLLAAALQFVWAKLRPSAGALRLNAARFAFYGVGSLLVAIAHAVLLKVGPGLLK